MSKTYAEKLKDPRWQKKRLEILERDKFACRYCADKEKTLHVHHVYYEKGKSPWEYEGDMLLTLCERCHELLEMRNKMILKRMLFSSSVATRVIWFLDSITAGAGPMADANLHLAALASSDFQSSFDGSFAGMGEEETTHSIAEMKEHLITVMSNMLAAISKAENITHED